MFNDELGLLDRWYWNDGLADWGGSSAGRIAVVGRPGVGKKALCNSLWGWEALESQPTNGGFIHNYGLFSLVDVPDDPLDVEQVMFRLEGIDLVIYLLDAEAPDAKADFSWITRLRSLDLTLVVALNKVDKLDPETRRTRLAELEERLARRVVPLCAQDQAAVRNHFLPLLLKACPKVAVPLAAEVKGLREKVAHAIIREYVMASSVSHSPGNLPTEPQALVNMQTAMLNRIAALYGFKNQQDMWSQGTLSAILSQLHHTYAQWVPSEERSSMFQSVWGAVSTWLVGRAAVLYYEANLPSVGQWLSGKNPYDTPQKRRS